VAKIVKMVSAVITEFSDISVLFKPYFRLLKNKRKRRKTNDFLRFDNLSNDQD
jgi:hypothetical protein